jgi:hypothetical protein
MMDHVIYISGVAYLHRMDHVSTIDHDTSVVLAVSMLALGVENDKSDKEIAIDELKTLLLPLVARLKKAKEAGPNSDADWLCWFPIITGAASGHITTLLVAAKQRKVFQAWHPMLEFLTTILVNSRIGPSFINL